jgi:DNA-binding transcriptional ArsR family regulator
LRGFGSGGANAIAWRLENAGQFEGGRGIGRSAHNFLFFYLRRLFFGSIVNHMVKYSPRTLNRTFAALADPTRRRILAHLAHGDRCVTDLARPHAMSLPAVSKHLRVLEKAGLLRRRRYGRVHEMQLDAKPLQQAAQWVEEYRKFWEGSLDRLAEYLEKTNRQSKKKKMR